MKYFRKEKKSYEKIDNVNYNVLQLSLLKDQFLLNKVLLSIN